MNVLTGNIFDKLGLELFSVFTSCRALTVLLQGLEVLDGDLARLTIRSLILNLLARVAAACKLSHIYCGL